ncbi:MAG TPA: hypothetical protein VMV81_12190 [Phycisphaerae bacterium]|nr:hypothetical protein [Phycisphaerae bacterium]
MQYTANSQGKGAVMGNNRKLLRGVLPVGLFILAGCSGIGPQTIVPSRFDYTAAIGDSWKQQMLMNMVKTRYGDTLVFLDVTSVISQFQIIAGSGWSGTFNNQSESNVRTLGVTGTAADPVTGAISRGATFGEPFLSSSQNFGVTGGYADRPTITYVPLSGAKFTRTLMKPIPPPAILSLIQSGYPINLVLRFCVHSVNGVRNRYGGSGRPRSADPEFYPLLERLRKIQDSGSIGLRVQRTKEMEAILMTLRGKADSPISEEIAWVRKTLGIDPKGDEFRVVYGSVAKDSSEIAILTRSVLEIMIDLASAIEVPAAHVEENRVRATMEEDTVAGVPIPPLIKIHSARFKPGDAFVAVPYRNYWFYIDDRDMQSKSVFSFLMYLFSLTDTEEKEGAPIITIPSG